MSDNPYQPPAHSSEIPLPVSADLVKLKGIAQTQRWVHGWAFVQLGILVAANVVPVLGKTRGGEILLGVVIAFVVLSIFVGNIQLAYRTKGIGSAVVIGLVSWIPWANLIAALIVTAWATKILRAAGFKVGLFGVRARELPKPLR